MHAAPDGDMLVQAVYHAGARKAIVVGVGPLGCSPLARASNTANPGECVEVANQLALGFNAALKQMVDGLRAALPGFNLVLANTFDTVSAMITDGKAFGKRSRVLVASAWERDLQQSAKLGSHVMTEI